MSNGASPDGERALVNQAPAGLDPSGFDPSRVDESGFLALSNGMTIYVGDPARNYGFDYERNLYEMIERMIAAGHTPEADEDGHVNFFVTSGGYCNGPGCSVCHDTVCQHCNPDWQPDPCPGAEAYAAEQRERRRAEYLKLKDEFEPEGMRTNPVEQPHD